MPLDVLACSLAVFSLSLLVQASAQSAEPAVAQTDVVKVRLSLSDGRTADATLVDNETTRTFAALLPLRIPMSPHFERELYGRLPRSITTEAGLQRTYGVGDIAYWPPGPGFAIYYKVDGPPIPGDGIAPLGTIDSGVEVFEGLSGDVTVSLLP